MSVLWSCLDGDRTVEVRSAGRTRRLYIDGVLQSSWSPQRPLTGAIWDPLALAALLAPAGSVREALVLGVGGGAAIHLLERHLQPDHIVGVEIDGLLLEVARRWFDLERPGVELVEADANRWVRRNGHRRFDLIVDDLFMTVEGEPVRSGLGGTGWWHSLTSMLSDQGVLVVNFATRQDLVHSTLWGEELFRQVFPSAFRFSWTLFENAIIALSRTPMTTRSFRRVLANLPTLKSAAARRLLRFRMHTLWCRSA